MKWCLIRGTTQSIETLASPLCSKVGLLSLIEPTSVDEALKVDEWNIAMQEELNQL
jgi:hypothetical protein